MSKKLYLLAVGVNEFLADGVSNLNGCENDAKAIYEYLETSSKNTEFEFDGKMLLSADAKKAEVVKYFQEHLGQAKTGDVAVFYFSGHGAEEKADKVFHPYLSGETITTIVCHDSRTGNVVDLADKEIRYLVNEVSGQEEKPHFVLIMDSCHSGGATRSEMKPRLTGETDVRDWSQFIFADKISKEDVTKAVSLGDVLPEGEHIHLSSCQDDELAYEVEGSGVFTSSLLDILSRTAGKVSYRDINNRIRLKMKGKFPQRPTIYAPVQSLQNDYFLGGASANKGQGCNVVYNTSNYVWKIDLGAVHGLTDNPDEPSIILIKNNDGKQIAKATVDTCSISESTILIDPEDISKVDKRDTYSGIAENIYKPFISFYLTGEQEGLDILNEYFGTEERQASLKRRNIRFVDKEIDASYVIRGENQQFLITLPFDKRPLVKQLLYRTQKKSLFNLNGLYFHSITQWEYLSNIYNERTRLRPKPPCELSIYKVIDDRNPEKDVLLQRKDGVIYIENLDSIRVKVSNNTRNKTLYYALFYLGMDFGAWELTDDTNKLKPEQTYWAQEREAIEFEINDYITDFNFEYQYFEFKLICSTDPITNFYEPDTEGDSVTPLPEPVYPALDPEDLAERPIQRRKRPDQEDWATDSIRIMARNPNYKPEK